jgi:hypothetical protein
MSNDDVFIKNAFDTDDKKFVQYFKDSGRTMTLDDLRPYVLHQKIIPNPEFTGTRIAWYVTKKGLYKSCQVTMEFLKKWQSVLYDERQKMMPELNLTSDITKDNEFSEPIFLINLCKNAEFWRTPNLPPIKSSVQWKDNKLFGKDNQEIVAPSSAKDICSGLNIKDANCDDFLNKCLKNNDANAPKECIDLLSTNLEENLKNWMNNLSSTDPIILVRMLERMGFKKNDGKFESPYNWIATSVRQIRDLYDLKQTYEQYVRHNALIMSYLTVAVEFINNNPAILTRASTVERPTSNNYPYSVPVGRVLFQDPQTMLTRMPIGMPTRIPMGMPTRMPAVTPMGMYLPNNMSFPMMPQGKHMFRAHRGQYGGLSLGKTNSERLLHIARFGQNGGSSIQDIIEKYQALLKSDLEGALSDARYVGITINDDAKNKLKNILNKIELTKKEFLDTLNTITEAKNSIANDDNGNVNGITQAVNESVMKENMLSKIQKYLQETTQKIKNMVLNKIKQ